MNVTMYCRISLKFSFKVKRKSSFEKVEKECFLMYMHASLDGEKMYTITCVT